MFNSFKMPDFCARPEGKSKSLKEAYIYLRCQGVPDSDIFIYAQGEFYEFKGEILDQQPQAGDMVYTESRITLTAAVSGICQVMPDLFTDHMSGSLADDSNPRQGAKNLFAIFDNMFLKMLCRLDWIRDIYAGIYHSPRFIDYQNAIFFNRKSTVDNYGSKSLDFILSKLSRFLGTEGTLKVFLETATGLRVDTEILDNQKTPLPDSAITGLGEKSGLGESIFLGENFESEKPKLRISFKLDKAKDVPKAIEIVNNKKLLENVLDLILPYYSNQYEISVEPGDEDINFINGNSYLGYSTALGFGDGEKS